MLFSLQIHLELIYLWVSMKFLGLIFLLKNDAHNSHKVLLLTLSRLTFHSSSTNTPHVPPTICIKMKVSAGSPTSEL